MSDLETLRALHCWKDRQAHIEETHGFHSEEHIQTYTDDFKNGTCLLERNHEGEHEFTDDDCVEVTFIP